MYHHHQSCSCLVSANVSSFYRKLNLISHWSRGWWEDVCHKQLELNIPDNQEHTEEEFSSITKCCGWDDVLVISGMWRLTSECWNLCLPGMVSIMVSELSWEGSIWSWPTQCLSKFDVAVEPTLGSLKVQLRCITPPPLISWTTWPLVTRGRRWPLIRSWTPGGHIWGSISEEPRTQVQILVEQSSLVVISDQW